MIGPVGGLIAQLTFWTILALGLAFGEIGRRGLVTFVIVWCCGVFGLPRLGPTAALFVTPYIAVVDVVLVFAVFRGDVRLS